MHYIQYNIYTQYTLYTVIIIGATYLVVKKGGFVLWSIKRLTCKCTPVRIAITLPKC